MQVIKHLKLLAFVQQSFFKAYQIQRFLLLIYNCQMGCGSSDLDSVKLNKKRETVFGVLQVHLHEAVIEHETSTVFSMDPYVNVKFSNQKKTGAVVKKGAKNPKFNDIFKFIVNSCYKYYGRCLEIELMDSNTGSDSLIGYGIIDLDPYLNALQVKSPEPAPGQVIQKSPQTISLRCFLNYDRTQAGFITLSATFKEEKVEVVHFRFETAEFKRSTRTFGDMNCSVRVTAGEEMLQTSKKLDTKHMQPVWKDEHISFSIPESLEHVMIEVMDEQNIIGSIKMSKLEFLVQKTQEKSFVVDITHKGQVAGKLRFSTLLTNNPTFKELNGEYKKKTPEEIAAEKKKAQGKSQEKKPEEKKGEEKKPEEKKPQEIKVEQKKQEKKPEGQPAVA